MFLRPQKVSSWRPDSRADASSRRMRGVRTIELRIPPFRRACIPTSTFSSAVMFWNRRMFWNVRPMPRSVIACGGIPVTSSPSNTIRPDVGL